MKRLCLLLLSLFVSATSYGAFSIQLDAGQLRSNPTTGLPAGSLLMFISAGANGVFDTPTSLTAGSYVAGDDVLVSVQTDPASASAFDTQGGTNETINLFNMTATTAPAGQALGLMWFPQITYAQWQAGTTPAASQTFGFYNPIYWGNATNNPDLAFDPASQPWLVPATGLIHLDFFTTDSTLGGTQAPMEGFGNNFTVAIPEPSSLALLSVGLAGAWMIRKRRRSAA